MKENNKEEARQVIFMAFVVVDLCQVSLNSKKSYGDEGSKDRDFEQKALQSPIYFQSSSTGDHGHDLIETCNP